MKLTTRDIDPYLKQRPKHPVVLVYGPDHGLVKTRAQILAKYIISDLSDPFNVGLLTGDQIAQNPARFTDETSALSMMGGDRVVFITNATDNITPTLKLYLASSPPTDTIVIISADDLSTKSTLRKLCETDVHAAALPCYVQDANEIGRLVQNTLRAANLTIDRDALSFFSDAIRGDNAQVQSEIDKLVTYMGVSNIGLSVPPKTVTYDDVVACSGMMGLATLDYFIDAILLGDASTAFSLFKKLDEDGVAEIALLRGMLAHGRKLQSTQLRIANGEDLSMIMDGRDAPVFFKRKSAFTTQLRKWPLPKLGQLMHDILMAEMKLKSGTDAPATLPQMFLALSARAGK